MQNHRVWNTVGCRWWFGCGDRAGGRSSLESVGVERWHEITWRLRCYVFISARRCLIFSTVSLHLKLNSPASKTGSNGLSNQNTGCAPFARSLIHRWCSLKVYTLLLPDFLHRLFGEFVALFHYCTISHLSKCLWGLEVTTLQYISWTVHQCIWAAQTLKTQ